MKLAVIVAAVIGAALIEVIRNSLLLFGFECFWQGTFVGSFIVQAVAVDKLKGSLAEGWAALICRITNFGVFR